MESDLISIACTGIVRAWNHELRNGYDSPITDTADYMYRGRRYFYAVFMCHLAIEKSLKGLYYERLRQLPPKTHSLIYLLSQIEIKPPEDLGTFIVKLSEASIPTRYPEDLGRLQQEYTGHIVKELLAKAKNVIQWIKQQL